MTPLSPQEKEALLALQHKYYAFVPALFEIVKEVKNRTFDMLTSKIETENFGTRYFYAGSVDFLKKHLEAMNISKGKHLINIYRSNALLKEGCVPVFSYDLTKRKDDPKYKEFNDNYLANAVSFDLIVDIDGQTIEQSFETAKEVKALFDEFKLPYYVKNSGRRGFHIIIPGQYMPSMPIDELIKTIYNVLYNMMGIHGWVLDLSTINPKGIIKCAYSFDSGNISLPLNDYEFVNFTPDKVRCEYVLRSVFLKNRGLKIREYGLSKEELCKNVKNFFREYQ